MARQLHSGRVLRELMRRQCVTMPGSFNGLVARAVAAYGYQATYLSGGSLANSHGVPDNGLLRMNQFCDNAIQDVSRASALPVLAEADSCFGDSVEAVTRTVFEYNKAGAAGLHIEDQVFPKRCGHLDGKELIPVIDMKQKVAGAVKAADECSGGDFIVCARTDARSVEGLKGAIDRSCHYIDSGASMIFPEGLANIEEFTYVAEALRKHNPDVILLANMTEFGKTDIISQAQFKDTGYSCVIYPVSTQRVAMRAIDLLLQDLKTNGIVTQSLPNMQTRDELYHLLNYTPGEDWIHPNPMRPSNNLIQKRTQKVTLLMRHD